MQTLFINGLPDNEMIRAICWTLIHSLWQGMLLTIGTTIIITITRRSASALRYNLLAASFILFIATSAFTFVREILITKKNNPIAVWTSPLAQNAADINITSSNTIGPATEHPTYFDAMVQYFNTHASLIVAVWFILFSVKFVKILANIGYVQRIRRYKTFAPPVYWTQRITELAKDLHIQQSIILLESAIIKAPMVFGLLKPVILVPLSLLSNLPPEQIEAVLLHELAHIRRKDYLVNLLQSFAEVIFFFNPAVMWISSLIREERENCCDDITISRIKNKNFFIYALIAFQEYTMHPSNTSTAIAFAGRKKYLLHRVKRIIHNENKKLNAMEKGIFIFSIVAISFIGFVSMKRPTTQKAKSPVKASFFKNVSDTLPVQKDEDVKDTLPAIGVFTNISSIVNKDDNSETKTITANDKNGEKYKIIMKNDELLELYVNDKKIPPEEINKYEKLITAIEQAAEYRQKEDMIKMKMAQVEQNKKMKELDAERNELMERLSALDAERAELEHERNKQSTDHEWEDAAGLKYLDDLKMKMRNEDLKNQTFDQLLYDNKQELLRKNAKTDEFFQKQLFDEKEKTFDNNYENPILNELKENILQKQLFNEKALNNEYENPLLNNRDAFENYQQQLLKENMFQNNLLEQEQRTNILIDPIIQEMVMENIIPPHQEEVSFELNDKAFIVNGKKQPSEVHERFKKKYLKNEGDYFKFSRKDGHTSTTIHLK